MYCCLRCVVYWLLGRITLLLTGCVVDLFIIYFVVVGVVLGWCLHFLFIVDLWICLFLSF